MHHVYQLYTLQSSGSGTRGYVGLALAGRAGENETVSFSLPAGVSPLQHRHAPHIADLQLTLVGQNGENATAWGMGCIGHGRELTP